MKDQCEIKLTRDREAIHSFIHSFHPFFFHLFLLAGGQLLHKELEDIMLNEISQTEKDKYCTL